MDYNGVYAGDLKWNQFYMTRASVTNGVNAYSAYIIPEEGATGEITFDFEGSENGIVIATDNARRDSKVYSIDGRVIGTADNLRGIAKGLYIVRGKKMVIK